MTTDITLYNAELNFNFIENTAENLYVDEEGIIHQQNNLPEILFVTSFPPRECGIATYSQDLINALNNQFYNSFNCSICALESKNEQHIYKQKPKLILNTDNRNSFLKTAYKINNDQKIKLVVMQHEFGFYAANETKFSTFFESITKTIIFVFHTVLPNQNDEFRSKVKKMSSVAASIIVMTNDAANILKNEYKVDAYKITVIAHGTHLVPQLNRRKLKNEFNFLGRKILSTFGLLSSSKSIETTLNALPEIIKAHPEVLFLVLGKTHPTVNKQEGEKYRNSLEEKVKELKIEKHVKFVNEYLELPLLLKYLQLSDIYLFTSKDQHQAVSGTFSYAISSGCPVISTPIPHAKEVINGNNGIIVDFENPKQLSEAVIRLLDNEKLRTQISNNSFHKMASTAWQNSAIAHALLFEVLTHNAFQLHYRIPKLNFSHLRKMTTNIGLIQFAKISNLDIKSGYTLDDNARAFIALCQHYVAFKNETDLTLINTYFQFIKYCLQPNGMFLNYVNEDNEFTHQNYTENLEDSTGRAIWALGFACSIKDTLPTNLTKEAEKLLKISLVNVENYYSTRAMAFIIKGLHYQNNKENLYILEIFANRIVQMYKHEKTSDWHWFEDYLTYGNSLLSEAMLCAYLTTNNEEFKKVAEESFDFLLSKIFINGKIKVVSNKGWFIKNKTTAIPVGGEQPIDVAYTILTLEKFYETFENIDYKEKAIAAFNWFLGENHLHQIVYNPCTGGSYDGVEEFNVNLNQGAESTVSYIMSRLAIERILMINHDPNLLEDNLILECIS